MEKSADQYTDDLEYLLLLCERMLEQARRAHAEAERTLQATRRVLRLHGWDGTIHDGELSVPGKFQIDASRPSRVGAGTGVRCGT